MVLIGLAVEFIVGLTLGFVVPHVGRLNELILSTISMVIVVMFSSFFHSLELWSAVILMTGWIAVTTGIASGKIVRLFWERRWLSARLVTALPLIHAFLTTCDKRVRGQASNQDVDLAWQEARQPLRAMASLQAIMAMLDELRDLSNLLADDGLTTAEETVWRKMVSKTAETIRTLA